MIKILFVDDEKGITDSLEDFFKIRGFHVKSAGSGEEALSSIRQERPDIVFLDVNMKGINGVDTLKKIKEYDRSINVIMLTVLDNQKTIKEAEDNGADGFMTKPFSVDAVDDVIIKKVQELMNRKF